MNQSEKIDLTEPLTAELVEWDDKKHYSFGSYLPGERASEVSLPADAELADSPAEKSSAKI